MASLDQVFPGVTEGPVTLFNYSNSDGQPLAHEMIALCQLVRFLKPRTIFEIGTFEGGTTLQLAANSEAEIWTLDLPPDHPIRSALDCVPAKPGWRIAASPFADRCTQLFGDSQSYDFEAWKGGIDLVFVDASHEYEHVRLDTRNALGLLSEGGVVVWHDYAPDHAPGVVRCLEEMAGTQLVHLEGTGLVVRPPAPPSLGA